MDEGHQNYVIPLEEEKIFINFVQNDLKNFFTFKLFFFGIDLHIIIFYSSTNY